MAGERFDIGAYIKLDGESWFKSEVTAVNNPIKGMKAELKNKIKRIQLKNSYKFTNIP